MRRAISAVSALGVVILAVGCASDPPPAAKAAQVERDQCATGADQAVALMRSMTVLRSEAIYSHFRTGNNNSEERVSGAKLVVRPPSGITADQLTRALQCHSARVLLGQAAGVQDDPTSLPNSWVDIDVQAEHGNFAVTLTADSVRENLQVLRRATKYADEHQVAVQPEM
jgi:hypothetical protein